MTGPDAGTPATPPPPVPPVPPQDDRDGAMAELLRIRASIDNLDAALVHILAERFKHTQRVGHLKAAHDMPPSDPQREVEQIARLRRLAEDAHLDPVFAEKFLGFVIEEVIRHHKAIAADAPAPPRRGSPA